ncbi:sigma-70 family RNA polymerase sigma factor [Dactylosporangium darangshiense]|uniref:RNA polymerase sigma factor RpoE n=1 Tax=Dactylosporangium darangshiense TaxID=579108 RepID=A0ABP8CYZ2_9ACTN
MGTSRAASYTDAPDSSLIAWSRAGDTRAFDALARRHERSVHLMCLRFAGDPDEARDLLQEVLVKVWRSLERFDGRSALQTWMYRIVVNTAIDFSRSRRRIPVPAGEDLPAPVGRSPEHAVTSADSVRRALAMLPEEFRVTVILADCMQCTYDEIAELSDVPVGTVKSRLARARAALRDLLNAMDAA